MEFEYHWWDLEGSTFKGELLETIGCFYLYDLEFASWEEFEAAMPHMAYTHLVSTRFDLLEQQFVDLRVIPQMLAIESFPISSSAKPINRFEWLKTISDLTLMRFSSIRDLSLRFVNELLELKIPERNLRTEAVRGRLSSSHRQVADGIVRISGIGPQFRSDRNRRMHEGHVDLRTDNDPLFKFMASGEEYGSTLVDYDISAVYCEVTTRSYEKLVLETGLLIEAVASLADELLPEFNQRYFAKRPKDFNVPTQ